MKIHSSEHLFARPWSVLASANWVKYPNPITTHVVSIDYLHRATDPATGILYTERLLQCTQNIPSFISRLFGGINCALMVERSWVDAESQTLRLETRNLTLAEYLTVQETCLYEPSPTDPDKTLFKQEAQITSSAGFEAIQQRIESFSLSCFQRNAAKGRAAMESVLGTAFPLL